MKLLQFSLPDEGVHAGLLEGETILDLTSADPTLETVNDLLNVSCERGISLEDVVEALLSTYRKLMKTYPYEDLNVSPDTRVPHVEMPFYPPEVWAFGVTYQRSADERDKDSSQDIYTRVYYGKRPELFFKATPPRCVGPNGSVGIRCDSQLTAVEPELAYILGKNGEIIGYTICNDVSAWDIERENPLYLPQSKIFTGCCAIGPVLATSSGISDPYDLAISCRIYKGGRLAYEASVSTAKLNRTFEEMTEYLTRDNPVPVGTMVSTGTGIMVPNDLTLVEGDTVEIEIEQIGTLRNSVKQLGK
ncbi:MAG: fumarylacetoacetate hydrolase family protein [Candidatus Latescibacteria bacterium]|nr:fumarylacetoacetate hydrolase family protein [Candidatus Latescibacterota bacterium]